MADMFTQDGNGFFVVDGSPVPQPRHRVARSGGRYIPKGHAIHAWRDAVAVEAFKCFSEPLEGPVSVVLTFRLPAPQADAFATPAWHVKRPDTDNLTKAVLDAISGVAFKDDSQVCSLNAYKQKVRHRENSVLFGGPGLLAQVRPAYAPTCVGPYGMEEEP